MIQKVITKKQFTEALPKHRRKYVNQDIVDQINGVLSDPALMDAYADNIIMYTSVMQEGRFKVADYIKAVQYVSCKLLGASNKVAWKNCFPARYQHYLDIQMEERHIDAVVSAYNRGMLVNKIYEQTLIPAHIYNQGTYQKAINKLAELMMYAKSEKVQSDSAARLVEALKMPETQKIELDLNVKADNSINELRESTLQLVAQQRQMLTAGAMSPKQVAHSKLAIVDIDYEDVDEEEKEG